ncbi:reverse transcriptase domain-containing protein [Tanacetum coccineum]
MYSFNLENIVPSGGLACLIAKATIDESNKWHKRFSWVFFLRTKDETSGILKDFIRQIENQSKGIKTEYSNARTPQQNRVTKRKNMTLIEAAKTMLAFRVYNLETKRVEENQHITSLENKPNVAGKGPTWLFDLDYLIDSMNYQPVRSENQANKHVGPQETNHNAGTKDNLDVGDSKIEAKSAQDYFEMAPKRATRSTPVTENPTTTTVTNAQLQAMIDQGVTAALAARDANRNGDDSHTSGTGARRTERVARECTYQDFMKCQPLYFKGTEGVVELTQWFERMETVFRISNCSVENQIKFSTCTLLAGALTWWNSHVRIVGHDVAYAMTWIDLRKKMTDKYCPRNEIKKLETELWNLKVKGTDVTGYNQRFQELALLCVRMFPEESDKVERYVGGLPDMIHGSVVASKPKTMQEATEMATELMDKKISTLAERQAENKRKLDNNNQAQQQSPKRQNVARAYTAGTSERKEYAETLPLCNRCKLHHNGPCTVKCGNCKKVGHMTRDCRNPAAARNQRNLTCYECGNQRHYRSDCPELKNQNHGNQAEGTKAGGMVYALGGGETDQDLNNIEDDIEA